MKTILVSAYGCEPNKGSEAGVGWNWVLQMAKHNRLHVITRANNQELIEAHLPLESKEKIKFYYYDAPEFIKSLKNKSKGLYFYYFCWQLGIIPLVRQILKQNKIDYTMHLTFGSMWMPTFLPFFRTAFIWGPVGGGDCEPKSFLKVLPLKQKIMQTARYVMNTLSFLHPSIMFPATRAKVILARTENSANVIPRCFKNKTKIILETAMEDAVFEFKKKNREDDEIRLITSGRLLPNKYILTAVRSLKYVNNKQKVIYDELPRQKGLELLEHSDIFLFPSLREGGSWSLMEAMAISLPVICLNWAGMAVTTDDLCAIRLPVTNPQQMP